MQKILDTTLNSRRFRTWSSLFVILGVCLAVTIPFARQAFSLDGPLELDYAQSEVSHPLAQGLTNYSYWGIQYDNYLNTHPRLLSLYLSVVSRIAGGLSEVPVHASLVIFPLIGAVSMYFLGRRFGISGLAAALLFLVSPMLMVNSHLEMVDVPGTSLWIAAIAAFVFAVDRRSNLLLVLSALLMVLTTQTFFQGLAVLPLALLYIVINKKFRLWNFMPIAAAALLFGGYLAADRLINGQFPRFSYREQYNFNQSKYFLGQLRGNLTTLGGTLMFPLAAVAALAARWTAAVVFVAASVITWSWSAVKFKLGIYDFSDMLLLSILLPVGITIGFLLAERLVLGIFRGSMRRSQTGKDAIFLGIWFFGVLGYAVAHLAYPAPRYLLPALPPVIFSVLLIWKGLIRKRWLGFSLAAGAIGVTVIFSTVLSITYRDMADDGRVAAQWAVDTAASQAGFAATQANDQIPQDQGQSGQDPGQAGGQGAPGRVASVDPAQSELWYNGGFGFGYYLQQDGLRSTPNILNELYSETARPLALSEPKPGDQVAYSLQNGAWVPYPAVMQRLRLEQIRFFYDNRLLSMPCGGTDKCWWSAVFLPYTLNFDGEKIDQVMLWRIDSTPNPLDDNQKQLYRDKGISWIDDLSEK